MVVSLLNEKGEIICVCESEADNLVQAWTWIMTQS